MPQDRDGASSGDAGSSPEGLSFAPGTRIGRYTLLGPVGEGGMGVVVLAYDPELDRRVALKLERVGKLGASGRRRLQREAQALARLSHPNVVPVYDAGAFGEHAFVAMEYVAGRTMRAWLDEPRSWREVVAVLREAGRGLAAAHRAGLIHRDFKPANVILGDDGRVRVLDFGLARSLEERSGEATPSPFSSPVSSPSQEVPRRQLAEVTQHDQVVGTPRYMAPEQAAKRDCDERVDQYSFGVTLYRALYGGFPEDSTLTAEQSTADERPGRAVNAGVPERPRHDVPTWLHRVCMRAMARDPADRYPSMDALLSALAHDARWPRRILLAGLVLAACAATAIVTARARSERRLQCNGAPERIAAILSPETTIEIRAAFARSGLPYATALADSLERELTQWGERWQAAHRDACAATHVRGEQSPEALDLRMACLDAGLREVAAVTRALAGADKATVKRAPDIARGLPSLEECADVTSLRGLPPPPRDEVGRRQYDALGQRVAELQALYYVGRARECVNVGEPLVAELVRARFIVLQADAEMWTARCYSDLHDEAHAMPRFAESFADALAARKDHTAARAAVRLAQEYLFSDVPDHAGQYERWRRIGEGIIARQGGDGEAELILMRVRCTSLFDTGEILDRLRCMEDVVRHADSEQRLTEWDVSMLGLSSIDAGRLDDGVRWLEKGVARSLQQLGANHPRTIENRAFLGYAYSERGDAALAVETLRQALREAIAAGPSQIYLQTRARLYLATALRELGRLDEARQALAEASAARQDDFAADLAVEEGEQAARAGASSAAIAALSRALALDVKTLTPTHPNTLRDLLVLGRVQLDAGLGEAARANLELAERRAAAVQLSPLFRADLDFAMARALPADARQRALALAQGALTVYREQAPATSKFARQRAAVESFLK